MPEIHPAPDRATVLVVDDDEVVRTVLRALLRRSGFRALTASNGEEAISIIRSVDLDAVVTDLSMPVVDGYSLIEWMRCNRPHLHTVVVSATAGPDVRRHSLDRGVVDHLHKPVDPLRLLDLLHARDSVSGLSGSLSELEMLEYLAAVVRAKRSVLLELVTSDQETGRIYIDRGRILHATLGDAEGDEAFISCTRQRRGIYTTRPWRAPARRTIRSDPETLLLRAARLIADR